MNKRSLAVRILLGMGKGVATWGLGSVVLVAIFLPIVALILHEDADKWAVSVAIVVFIVNGVLCPNHVLNNVIHGAASAEHPGLTARSKSLRFGGWCVVVTLSICVVGPSVIAANFIWANFPTSVVIVTIFVIALPLAYAGVVEWQSRKPKAPLAASPVPTWHPEHPQNMK